MGPFLNPYGQYQRPWGTTLFKTAHVDYILSQPVRKLGLIRTITYSLFTLDSLLYLALVRPKLEYASTV